MDASQREDLKPMKEQLLYANILNIGAWSGLALLAVTYILYVAGVVPGMTEMTVITGNWHTGIHDFQAATNGVTGWAWLGRLGYGEYLNFIGLAILASLSIVCYCTLIPGYLRQNDKIYLGIVIAEIVVLCVAASGILGSGGH